MALTMIVARRSASGHHVMRVKKPSINPATTNMGSVAHTTFRPR